MTVRCYLRVSTADQAESGLGLAAQRSGLVSEARRKRWDDVVWYEDPAKSGKSLLRPKLQLLLGDLVPGDTLAVAKLDRLSRSVLDFARLIELARDQGWNLVVLDPSFDLAKPYSKAMAQMAMVFAELERELISQRTKVALAEAKAKGVLPGLRCGYSPEFRQRLRGLRAEGVTFQAIADLLNEEGVATTYNAVWRPSTVHAVLKSDDLEREAAARREAAA